MKMNERVRVHNMYEYKGVHCKVRYVLYRTSYIHRSMYKQGENENGVHTLPSSTYDVLYVPYYEYCKVCTVPGTYCTY